MGQEEGSILRAEGVLAGVGGQLGVCGMCGGRAQRRFGILGSARRGDLACRYHDRVRLPLNMRRDRVATLATMPATHELRTAEAKKLSSQPFWRMSLEQIRGAKPR